jgi:hypothetical protein
MQRVPSVSAASTRCPGQDLKRMERLKLKCSRGTWPCESWCVQSTALGEVVLTCSFAAREEVRCAGRVIGCNINFCAGCEHICPDGVMQATGRSSRAKDQREIEALRKRVGELEDALNQNASFGVTPSPRSPQSHASVAEITDGARVKSESQDDFIDTVGSVRRAPSSRTR